MKGRAIAYSDKELTWLEANRLMSVGEYASAFNKKFGRQVDPKNLHALRKRKGWKTGRTGCFEKGHASWNKGQSHPSRGRSIETQFKKGNRTGRANHVYKPIGTERITRDGYVERKIHDGMPLQSRWRAVHLLNWEATNGPLPKGHALKCMDGNKANTDPSNWEAVPRALLPRLAGGNRHRNIVPFDDAAPELRPALLAMAKLEHACRQKRAGTQAR